MKPAAPHLTEAKKKRKERKKENSKTKAIFSPFQAMEDFDLTGFFLDDMDFDFSIFKENFYLDTKIKQELQDSYVHFNGTHHGFAGERPEASKSWQSGSCSTISNKSSLASSNPKLISFGFSNFSSPAIGDIIKSEQHGSSLRCGQGTKRKAYSITRSPMLAKEHVQAERKRREKLTERFIELSALLPDLKKADKATVLGGAIKHLNELQERIRKLEEEKAKKKDIESMSFVKKSRIFIDEESYLTSLSSDVNFNQTLPEIETKVSEKDVLVRIQCEKSKGSIVNIMREIEKFNLVVMNSIVLPFGDSTLDITVVAKMEENFPMTMNDLAKNLRLAMLQYL